MLAVLGFVTILLVLALIMSKKVSTLVALIFVPAITGFIAAFINAPNVIIQAAQAAAEKAGQRLLDDESLKIYEVAERTGYADSRYFSVCYKKYWHITPTDYRRTLQESG